MGLTYTLCGSTRFESQFHEANKELGRRGLIIISLSSFGEEGEQDEPDEETKITVDLVHLHKINMSSGIIIMGDGYIGDSTYREIMWCTSQNKPAYPLHAMMHALDADWNSIAYALKRAEWHQALGNHLNETIRQYKIRKGWIDEKDTKPSPSSIILN